MSTDTVKTQLLALADQLDSPLGPGSGAICLDAIAEIERLEHRIDPAEPSSAH